MNIWRNAAQTIAASNAQLCGRLLTAEAVVTWARMNRNLLPYRFRAEVDSLIAAHDAGRPS